MNYQKAVKFEYLETASPEKVAAPAPPVIPLLNTFNLLFKILYVKPRTVPCRKIIGKVLFQLLLFFLTESMNSMLRNPGTTFVCDEIKEKSTLSIEV